MIMTRVNFENLFGVEATQNTVRDLAILGKPAVYMAKGYNIPPERLRRGATWSSTGLEPLQ